MLGQQSGGAPRSTDDPAPTVTGDGAISLVRPAIIEYYGRSHTRDIDEPLSVITSMNKHGLVKAVLVEYYGQSGGADIDEPLPTVTAKARHGLANPVLVEVNHGNGPEGPRTRQSQDIITRRPPGDDHLQAGHGACATGPRADERDRRQRRLLPAYRPALPTLTTNKDLCVATPTAKPYIVPNFGERNGQEPRVHDVDDPVPAVTSRGAGSLVSPMLAGPGPEAGAGRGHRPSQARLRGRRPLPARHPLPDAAKPRIGAGDGGSRATRLHTSSSATSPRSRNKSATRSPCTWRRRW